MQRGLLQDDGVALLYKQVWKGKEVTNNIQGSTIKSYNLLWYAEEVLHTNITSTICFKSEKGHF